MLRMVLYAVPLLLLIAEPAQAYIGPGAGGGVVAVVLGVIGSVFLALAGIIWYPFKRLLKSLKSASRKSARKDPKSNDFDTHNSSLHNSDRAGSASASDENCIED